MPLPTGGKTPWPPQEWHRSYLQMEAHGAWYSGDPNRLSAYYGGVGTPNAGGRAEGFFGTQLSYAADSYDSPFWRRWLFWGKRASDSPSRYRLHIPLAGDIAQTSADLLFSEPPAFVIPDAREVNAPSEAKDIQQRLLDLVDEDGIAQTLLEAAEIAAALGGAYLRVTWDQPFAARPLLTCVHPDAAVPDFRYGCMVGVTFWSTLAVDGEKVYRHLERHEPGHILHGLYEGSKRELGRRIALSNMPATSSLLAGQTLDEQAAGIELDVPTGLDDLTAVYIPNIRPNREDRASPLGRSDYAGGVEGMMDALDEAWSSWMRELRLARARIMVPSEMLQTRGKGQGATFDAEQEVFTELNQLVGEDGGQIEFIQPAIRTADHMGITTALVEQAVRTAGYSPASFGLATNARIVTATEIAALERRSLVTRAKKALYWQRPLIDILTRCLEIDTLVFHGPGAARPEIQFADSVQEDPKDQATTLSLLHAAEAISTETSVRMQHPEWDEAQVAAEVGRIQQETGRAVPDPIQIGALP